LVNARSKTAAFIFSLAVVACTYLFWYCLEKSWTWLPAAGFLLAFGFLLLPFFALVHCR
jgi:4-amino-4-deoxy-L-arabinose transferase-like glycosyltransferase